MRHFVFIAVILAACLGASGVFAGALVNSETQVDVAGRDAADARTQAMIKGQQDALVSLLNKFTTPEQTQHIVNELDATKISAMVRGTEVLEEKMSANRYRAHLMVTFDGDQIGKGAAGNPDMASTTTGAFLIIPSYEDNGITALWEDTNPWRKVWKAVGLEITTGDIVVPFGDKNDSAVIDTQNAASANFSSLSPLGVRYGVSDIVVLQAKFTQTPDMMLTVVKRRINRLQNEVNVLTYRADPQETKDLLLLRAARDIAGLLEHKKTEELESTKVVRGGERHTMMVLASISTLASWTQVRAKLTGLPMIDRLELLAISPKQVDMVVHYRGTPDSLANAIAAQNLRLVKNPTFWVVSRD
jgi:hypothetical protein